MFIEWGFTHTLMKDIEFSLISLSYNFKRCMSIMDKKKGLIKAYFFYYEHASCDRLLSYNFIIKK